MAGGAGERMADHAARIDCLSFEREAGGKKSERFFLEDWVSSEVNADVTKDDWVGSGKFQDRGLRVGLVYRF